MEVSVFSEHRVDAMIIHRVCFMTRSYNDAMHCVILT